MPFVAQPTEKCEGCGKTVYATEKTVVEDRAMKKVFHKSCIRCTSCNKVLGLGEIQSQEGVFYCKPHWKQLFATKGNYDEAFGKEKSEKWTPVVSTAPKSFVPDTDSTKGSEKKETSEATLSKIKKFQEEGDANKCVVCAKTVYLAEKMILEDKSGKKLLHKACFKCTTCAISLNLENYGIADAKYYCKNHLKEVQKVAPTPTVVPVGPVSFVPAPTKEENTQKGQTPEHIAAKFKGFSENADRCVACSKLVYLNEKLVIGELTKQSLYHKTCFRCKHCNIQCDVTNYGSANGVIYCKVHLKTVARVEQAKSENAFFISPLAQKGTSGYVPTGVALETGEPQPSYDDASPSEEQPVETSTSAQESYSSEEHQQNQQQEELQEATNESAAPVETVTEQLESTSLDASSSSAKDTETGDNEEERRAERQKRREEQRRQKEEEERQQAEERQRRREEREKMKSEFSSVTEDGESKTDSRSERQRRREERERQEQEEASKKEEERKKRQEERRKRLEEASN